jgi:hypothetical protein
VRATKLAVAAKRSATTRVERSLLLFIMIAISAI